MANGSFFSFLFSFFSFSVLLDRCKLDLLAPLFLVFNSALYSGYDSGLFARVKMFAKKYLRPLEFLFSFTNYLRTIFYRSKQSREKYISK